MKNLILSLAFCLPLVGFSQTCPQIKLENFEYQIVNGNFKGRLYWSMEPCFKIDSSKAFHGTHPDGPDRMAMNHYISYRESLNPCTKIVSFDIPIANCQQLQNGAKVAPVHVFIIPLSNPGSVCGTVADVARLEPVGVNYHEIPKQLVPVTFSNGISMAQLPKGKSISVYSMSGQMLGTHQTENGINLSNLSPGLYILANESGSVKLSVM